MKSKLSLMAAMVGLAMLATPIAAAAKDHCHYPRRYGATWVPAPRPYPVHDWRDRDGDEWREHRWGDGDEWREHRWGDEDEDDDSRGYYPAPAYTAPVYGYGYRDPCQRARSVVNNYYKDRNTGHPAAANDLLRQNQWAFHSGCGVGPAPYNYGGYGNYGYGGYGQAYGGSSMLAPLLQYIR